MYLDVYSCPSIFQVERWHVRFAGLDSSVDRRKRRVNIVYRALGRAFVVHKNRDLEGNNFLAALGLVHMYVPQHLVVVSATKQKHKKVTAWRKKSLKKAKAEKIAQKTKAWRKRAQKILYIHKTTQTPPKGWGRVGWRLVFFRQMYCTVQYSRSLFYGQRSLCLAHFSILTLRAESIVPKQTTKKSYYLSYNK